MLFDIPQIMRDPRAIIYRPTSSDDGAATIAVFADEAHATQFALECALVGARVTRIAKLETFHGVTFHVPSDLA